MTTTSTDLSTQIADLKAKAEAADRESIRLAAQAEEAARVRDESLDKLVEMGVSSAEEALAKAEEIEAEVAAEVQRLSGLLA